MLPQRVFINYIYFIVAAISLYTMCILIIKKKHLYFFKCYILVLYEGCDPVYVINCMPN